jgi:3D (Asp-Asp-Asp) domain-containing protein
MHSLNFVPRTLTSALFLIIFSLGIFAQTSSLSEAWKTKSTQPATEVSGKSQTTNKPAEIINPTQNKDLPKTIATAWVAPAPVEPTVKTAVPVLNLEKEVAKAKADTLDIPRAAPNTELVGVEPPRSFEATAYSLRGITRSGSYVRRGIIAADPRVLPLGSVVHLKAGNYSGVYTVKDTGGAIKGKRIDLWVGSSKEAFSFGRRSVRLTVLKYGGKSSAKKRK